MTTALATRQPTHNDWLMIQAIASSAKQSGKLGLFRQEEAEMKLLVAWENNFPLTSAFGIVHVINNIPALSPKAVWAKVVCHPDFGGYKEERLEKNGKFFGYRITLKRKNGVEATRQFTLDDAAIAKLTDKDNWKHYEENMCYWRSMGHVEDVVFPDVTLGLARADMLGAMVTTDGEVIEGSWTVQPQRGSHSSSSRPVSQPEPAFDADRLQQMLAEHGAAAIMQANGGKIPSTDAELDAITEALNTEGERIYA